LTPYLTVGRFAILFWIFKEANEEEEEEK